jgi:hypothetical protein
MRSMPVRELMLCVALTFGYFTPVHSDEATTTAAPPPTKDAEATVSTPPATTEETEETDEKSQRAEFDRVAKQYKQTEKDGQTLYCRSEAQLGTRFKKSVCLTEAQLWVRIRKSEEARDEMRKTTRGPCPSPGSCN